MSPVQACCLHLWSLTSLSPASLALYFPNTALLLLGDTRPRYLRDDFQEHNEGRLRQALLATEALGMLRIETFSIRT